MNPEKIWVDFDDDWFAGDGIVYVQPFDPADGSVEYVRADRYREAVELIAKLRAGVERYSSDLCREADEFLAEEEK